jgi:PAS domain S-box-containing protein
MGALMEDRSGIDKMILEYVADAIIFANRSGTIVRWNPASTVLFGYPQEEAIGASLDLIIPKRLRAPHWKAFNAAIVNGTTKLSGRPTLTRAQHKDRRKLYVEMTFAIVRAGIAGNAIGSVAVARDVTERVEKSGAILRKGIALATLWIDWLREPVSPSLCGR